MAKDLANYLLVRDAGGFFNVEDAGSQATHGVRQALLSLANVTSRTESTTVATATLTVMSVPHVATAMGIEPTGTGDNPYADFTVGDYITAPDETGTSSQRVVSLTVAEDENGEASFAPELRSTLDVQEERIGKQLTRLINGALGGRSDSAAPNSSKPVTGISDA